MQDFQKLIDEIETTRKPEFDYRRLDPKTLLVLFQLYLLWERRVVMNIVDRPDSKPEKVWDEVRSIASNLNAKALTLLYSIRPDTKPLEYLIRWQLERKEIRRELDRRSKPYKLGREMIVLEEKLWEPANFKRLLAAARVERIKSRRPSKEDPQDLQQEALMGVAKWLANERKTVTTVRQTVGRGIPALPPEVGFPVNDKPPWDAFLPYRFWKSLGYVLVKYLPLLEGKPDQAVSQAKKNHWEKWEAQKRTGEDVPLEEAEKTTLRRSGSRVWRKKGERIEPEADRQNISHLDVTRAYQILEKRYGKKGRIFLDGLKETGRVTEASKRAGISRQMGHRYLLVIRWALSQRKK